jgi:uncharacterized protein (DUF2141 family)
MIRARFLGKPMSLFTVLLLLFTVPVPAQSPNSATLTIHIVNARNANGVIRVALFYSPEGFPGDASKALRTQPAKIDPQTLNAQAVFSGVPQGTYAVMVFHDENNNGKLDKNMIGIPKEGYGASDSAAKKMHAPVFDEAKFSLTSDQSVEVKLIY